MKTENNELHISSLVVLCLPAKMPAIRLLMDNIKEIDIDRQDTMSGKMIAVLETASAGQINHIIDSLHAMDGVISVAMVYHHCEPKLCLQEAME